MPTKTIEEQVVAFLENLSAPDKARTLACVKSFAVDDTHSGARKDTLTRFKGCVPREDLREMERAIAESSEQKDPNGW